MISLRLIFALLYGAGIAFMIQALREMTRPEPQPVQLRTIQVGKTLAEYRMRLAGVVNDDWQNWTTARLYGATI